MLALTSIKGERPGSKGLRSGTNAARQLLFSMPYYPVNDMSMSTTSKSYMPSKSYPSGVVGQTVSSCTCQACMQTARMSFVLNQVNVWHDCLSLTSNSLFTSPSKLIRSPKFKTQPLKPTKNITHESVTALWGIMDCLAQLERLNNALSLTLIM